ncbi:PREDICTED: HERV-H LTR-associating protein 2 [Nipponia nippon]|uniref:HERV-H LTR-associating protein 2 n=1 Tax=Nipponia nippon TaxID=128390 RepID=UPI0005115F36|nr:PREDICTED: HERV-H LTR-associating protein 2 [Nipponia nippon]
MGLFSKDCILPCRFSPGNDEVIYWKKGDKYVHSYYYQSDQLERQDPDYRHRTHLFHENIPSGNASLKLSNLTVTDEGSYNCYVGTQQTKTEVEVTLHVRVSSYYALEYQKTDTERMLKCYAFFTYPAPRISWVQGNTSIKETGRHETRDGVLYSLRSDQNIINTADPYGCRIHLPYEEWAAEWKMQVLASFNGTSHSYQPRAQINQSDFSLMLRDLTVSDSGEYLCNISTPHYTQLTVRTLRVESSANTWAIVAGGIAILVLVGVCSVFGIKSYPWRDVPSDPLGLKILSHPEFGKLQEPFCNGYHEVRQEHTRKTTPK